MWWWWGEEEYFWRELSERLFLWQAAAAQNIHCWSFHSHGVYLCNNIALYTGTREIVFSPNTRNLASHPIFNRNVSGRAANVIESLGPFGESIFAIFTTNTLFFFYCLGSAQSITTSHRKEGVYRRTGPQNVIDNLVSMGSLSKGESMWNILKETMNQIKIKAIETNDCFEIWYSILLNGIWKLKHIWVQNQLVLPSPWDLMDQK